MLDVLKFAKGLHPRARERLLAADDPLRWLRQAAKEYAERLDRAAARPETRSYDDRKEYFRRYYADRRAKKD